MIWFGWFHVNSAYAEISMDIIIQVLSLTPRGRFCFVLWWFMVEWSILVNEKPETRKFDAPLWAIAGLWLIFLSMQRSRYSQMEIDYWVHHHHHPFITLSSHFHLFLFALRRSCDPMRWPTSWGCAMGSRRMRRRGLRDGRALQGEHETWKMDNNHKA